MTEADGAYLCEDSPAMLLGGHESEACIDANRCGPLTQPSRTSAGDTCPALLQQFLRVFRHPQPLLRKIEIHERMASSVTSVAVRSHSTAVRLPIILQTNKLGPLFPQLAAVEVLREPQMTARGRGGSSVSSRRRSRTG